MVDLLPTMLDLAGRPVPMSTDGQSFAGLIDADPDNDVFRSAVLVEHWTTVANQRNALGQVVDVDFAYSVLRGPGYSYIEWDNGEREYYDLVLDPFQLENSYDQLSSRKRAELAAALEKLRSCTGRQCHDWGEDSWPPYPRYFWNHTNQPGSGEHFADDGSSIFVTR